MKLVRIRDALMAIGRRCLVALALLPVQAGANAPDESSRAPIARVTDIRARLLAHDAVATEHSSAPPADTLAQGNWANWPKWGKWANWANWGNAPR